MKDRCISLPIMNHYAGSYRLQYDGKYITLFGRDKNYPGFNFNPDDDIWYEEMVLIPIVMEVRNANPRIIDTNFGEIIIQLNIKD